MVAWWVPRVPGLGPGLRDGMRARRDACVKERCVKERCVKERCVKERCVKERCVKELREGACVGSAAEAAAAEVHGWHALKRCGLLSSWWGWLWLVVLFWAPRALFKGM